MLTYIAGKMFKIRVQIPGTNLWPDKFLFFKYFSNCKVRIGNYLSSSFPIENGLKQGDALSVVVAVV